MKEQGSKNITIRPVFAETAGIPSNATHALAGEASNELQRLVYCHIRRTRPAEFLFTPAPHCRK